MVRHARDYVTGAGRWERVLHGGIVPYEARIWCDLWFAEYALLDALRVRR